jgi:hypothetical protein
MTPKEKAEELFTTYRFALSIKNAPLGEIKLKIAKQCALVAVDEIIKTTFRKETWEHWKIIPQDESTTEFWNEVKQEIERF